MAIVFLGLVSACGSVNDINSGGAKPPYPVPSATPSADDLAAHLDKCEKGINEWKRTAGQINYPKKLTLKVDQPTTYNAVIDIRSAPLPPDEVITAPGAEPASKAIVVKCAVAARLVAVGEVTVHPEETDWQYREFSPAGVAEWAWTVTTANTFPKELRLDIVPAQLGTGPAAVGEAHVAQLLTEVEVEGTWIDRLSDWFKVQWPKLIAVMGILGLALTGAWRKLRGMKLTFPWMKPKGKRRRTTKTDTRQPTKNRGSRTSTDSGDRQGTDKTPAPSGSVDAGSTTERLS